VETAPFDAHRHHPPRGSGPSARRHIGLLLGGLLAVADPRLAEDATDDSLLAETSWSVRCRFFHVVTAS
jgi:hypothetical protein